VAIRTPRTAVVGQENQHFCLNFTSKPHRRVLGATGADIRQPQISGNFLSKYAHSGAGAGARMIGVDLDYTGVTNVRVR